MIITRRNSWINSKTAFDIRAPCNDHACTVITVFFWQKIQFTWRNELLAALLPHQRWMCAVKFAYRPNHTTRICCRLAGRPSLQQVCSKSVWYGLQRTNLQQVYSMLAACCRLDVDKSVCRTASLQHAASKSTACFQQIRVVWFDLIRRQMMAGASGVPPWLHMATWCWNIFCFGRDVQTINVNGQSSASRVPSRFMTSAVTGTEPKPRFYLKPKA